MYPAHIKEYIAELYSRIAEAAICGRAVIEGGNWQPLPNMCHDNVDIWCEHKEGYSPVRGWLYFDLGGILDHVMFLQHSVVRTPEGELFDITPSAATQEYPFIQALETDEEYFDKEQYTENGNLYHFFHE